MSFEDIVIFCIFFELLWAFTRIT